MPHLRLPDQSSVCYVEIDKDLGAGEGILNGVRKKPDEKESIKVGNSDAHK